MNPYIKQMFHPDNVSNKVILNFLDRYDHNEDWNYGFQIYVYINDDVNRNKMDIDHKKIYE